MGRIWLRSKPMWLREGVNCRTRVLGSRKVLKSKAQWKGWPW